MPGVIDRSEHAGSLDGGLSLSKPRSAAARQPSQARSMLLVGQKYLPVGLDNVFGRAAEGPVLAEFVRGTMC